MKIIYAIRTSLCLAFAAKLYRVLKFLDFFEEPNSFHDNECVKIISIGASEDQTKFNDNSILMTRWRVVNYLQGENRPGAMYVASGFQTSKKSQSTQDFAANDLNIQELPIFNYPENVDFHPHGIDILDSTLYVINHAYDRGGERIDVFDIITTEESHDGDGIPTHLDYKYSITSDWMKKVLNGALNSLTVVEHNKFYTTQYLPEAEDLSNAGWLTVEQKKLVEFLESMFLGSQKTLIWYCEYDAEEKEKESRLQCRKVAENMLGANGITHNQDYSKIFVADFKSIAVFDRDASTNNLTERTRVEVPNLVDNLKFDDITGNVYGGTVNSLWSVLKKPFPKESPELTSGVVELSQNKDNGMWEAKEMLSTSKMHCVSNGLRMHNYLVMGAGGFGYEGILVCPVAMSQSSSKTETNKPYDDVQRQPSEL